MPGSRNLPPDPSRIGRLLPPAFALLPDPRLLFRQRAARFAVLAQDSKLAPYLRFLAGVSGIQAELAAALPPPAPLPPEKVERARASRMPPLDRAALAGSPSLRDAVASFLDAVSPLDMPGESRFALDWLRQAPPGALDEVLGNLLANAIPADRLPQHFFPAAALQIHAAQLAATLDPARLVPV